MRGFVRLCRRRKEDESDGGILMENAAFNLEVMWFAAAPHSEYGGSKLPLASLDGRTPMHYSKEKGKGH